MDFVNGINRNQIQLLSLDQMVDRDSWARVVDLFVDALPLDELGFLTIHAGEGRPPFHPADLLKLYIYGYRTGIRSSRKLEKACINNVEVMWLLRGLRPKNRTIAYFRKNNAESFKNAFRHFVLWLKEWELIEGSTIAIDSVKIRAQNSLKNNFNQAKIDRHLDYIDQKVRDYTEQLDDADKLEETIRLTDKINHQKDKARQYRELEKQLKETGESQISTTDPDAKAVILHRNIVNVGYNVQFASDAKHKLLIHADTQGVNDTHALGYMATEVKDMLQVEHMNVLADKGYTTGAQLQMCKQEGITTYCSPKESSAHKNGLYKISEFQYDQASDSYSCPALQTLTTNGTYYDKGKSYRIKRYTTKACKDCPLRSACTRNLRGRFIERSEYQKVVEENRDRVNKNKDYYRERQQIIEHQFGTLKRQWHFDHTLMRGKEHVMSEVNLIALCYNLKRLMSILGLDGMKMRLKAIILLIWPIVKPIFASHQNDTLRFHSEFQYK